MSVLLSVMCMTYFVHSRVSNTEITYKKVCLYSGSSFCNSNFIYFTTITKQVIHTCNNLYKSSPLALMFALVWCLCQGIGASGENPSAQPSDHMTISYVMPGYRTWDKVVRGKHFTTASWTALDIIPLKTFFVTCFLSTCIYTNVSLLWSQRVSYNNLYLNYSVFPPIEDLSYGPCYSVKYDCPYLNFSLQLVFFQLLLEL